MELDKTKIPPGPYCYVPFLCPYRTTIEDEGVTLSYCLFLEDGDTGGIPEGSFDKLVKKYGSDDAVWEKYTLGLLWDGCKECGENWNEGSTQLKENKNEN